MKRVVVVGGSAGGIQALCSILRGIPGNFPAPILAVIHISQEATTLAPVLQRCTALKVATSAGAARIRAGHVYLPSANRHLIVKSGCALAVMGPRENRHRPAVDTLFRSAARAYRRSVVAVVLSGALDDGSAGALAVKSRGGTVIVQEPEDAEVPDMPANVLRQVKTDYCVKLKQIAPLLKRLAGKDSWTAPLETDAGDCEHLLKASPVAAENEPVAFTCPDCGGALLQIKDGRNTQLRCHVGHRFSMASFTEAQTDAVERALWVALRKLRERQAINEQLAGSSTAADLKRRFKENAAADAHDIRMIEEVLSRL